MRNLIVKYLKVNNQPSNKVKIIKLVDVLEYAEENFEHEFIEELMIELIDELKNILRGKSDYIVYSYSHSIKDVLDRINNKNNKYDESYVYNYLIYWAEFVFINKHLKDKEIILVAGSYKHARELIGLKGENVKKFAKFLSKKLKRSIHIKIED